MATRLEQRPVRKRARSHQRVERPDRDAPWPVVADAATGPKASNDFPKSPTRLHVTVMRVECPSGVYRDGDPRPFPSLDYPAGYHSNTEAVSL